jgi:hypothetical protein
MRRLVGVASAWLLVAAFVRPAAAAQSLTVYTDVTVGAARTLPSGAWGFSDGCQTGIAGGSEYRCAFEFNIAALTSSAKVTSAVLTIRRSAGCATNDCTVDLSSYTGNGSADLGDVAAGSSIATWTPNSTTEHSWNVLGVIQAHASNGDDWAGFRLAGSAGNTAAQDYDISASGTGVHLAVSFVAQPVDVQIYLAGNGEGANGTVTSSPAGIDCGASCVGTFEYAEPVTLTAHPASTATFSSWQGGPCDGSNNPVCSFDVPALNVETTAVFAGNGATQPPPTARPPTPKPSTKASTAPSHTPTIAPTTAPASATASLTPTQVPATAPAATAAATDGEATVGPVETIEETLAPFEPAAGGGASVDPIILIIGLVLIVAIGGAGYLFGRRSRGTAEPPGG